MRLPVIPPDALFNLRFLGIALTLVSGFTLVALLSPNGALTGAWAARATTLAGWAAGPWCVLALAAGVALYRGRKSLRRAVAGRLAGATLLLLAAAGVHQVLSAPPNSTRAGGLPPLSLAPAPGVDGQVGLLFGGLAATWFGATGATLVLAPLGMLGFGLLCGWSLAAWQLIGWRLWSGVRRTGRWLAAAAVFVWRGAGRLLHSIWRGASASGHAFHGVTVGATARWSAWRTVQATLAAERAVLREAEREAAELEAAEEEAAAADRLAARSGRQRDGDEAEAVLVADDEAVATDAAAATGVTLAPPKPRARPESLVSRPGVRPAGYLWELPSTSMLSAITAQQVSEAEMAEKARLIERTLNAFNVPVTVKEWRIGPTVTQFSLRPDEGVSVKKIKQYESDLQLVLSAQTLRIELPIPGRPVVGIEIPNSGVATVGLREILEAPQFGESKGRMRLALGRDVDGKPRVGDLAKMPHLLVAGQTGSGKSACINGIIASLLFQTTPDELQLLMIDPKMVEMAEYEGIPHLRYPVVVDLAEAGKILLWAVEEMERRYRLMAEAGFRHIDAYNKSLGTAAPRDNPYAPPPKPLPYMVIIIDELADLMMFAPDDVEPAICRLTAKARAVGIHLVVATQRPSVDVVTGLIKANMPSRIAFAVSSQIDSRVILDMGGAETLLGRGDMLYLPYDQGKPIRVQGSWVSDEEISDLIHFWKKQGSPQYVKKDEVEALVLKQAAGEGEKGDKQAPLLERSLALLQSTNYVSVSYLQRKLAIGYPRAARLMDDLEERGLVEADEGNGRSYRVVTPALDPLSALDDTLAPVESA